MFSENNEYLRNINLNKPKIINEHLFEEELEVRSLGIKDKLAKWTLHYKVSHDCGNSLLELLRSEGIETEVPKDIRTLMKILKHHEIMYLSI